MESFLPIVAGIGGTLIMTVLTTVSAFVMKKPFNVIRLLAFMSAFKPVNELRYVSFWRYLIAVLVHYAIGVAFGFVYHWLLNDQILMMRMSDAFLFGCALGVVAVITWRMFFAIHPSPPKLNLNLYLMVIFVGHVVLALTMFAVYNQFNETPLAASDVPLC